MEHVYRVFCTGDEVGQLPAGIEIVERYPAFVIARMDQGQLNAVRGRWPVEKLTPPPQMGAVVTTTTGESSPDDSRFRVLLETPVNDGLLRAIERAGGEVRENSDQFRLVVHAPNKAVRRRIEAALPANASVAPFAPEIKLSPELLAALPGAASAAGGADAGASPASIDPTPTSALGSVVATFFTSSERNKALAALKKAQVKHLAKVGEDRLVLHLKVSGSTKGALSTLIKQPGLKRVEERRLNKPVNVVAREILGDGVLLGSSSTLDGTGEIVAVCDTGLDTGKADQIHPDFAGRVKVIRSYPLPPDLDPFVHNPGGDDGGEDRYSGHGTHVAGSVLGSGVKAAQLGLPAVQGAAPAAKLVFQAIEQSPNWTAETLEQFDGPAPVSGLFGIPDDLKQLFQDAYQDGARIHTNSWGSSRTSDQGLYDGQCEDVDSFMWQKKDFLILFAAGNDGVEDDAGAFIKPGSISPPGTAKNCLTVGASENARKGEFPTGKYGAWWPNDFPGEDLGSDEMADSVDDIAGFSSRGPCKTSRRKPDVVAPGTFILSTRSSRIPENNFAWGAYAPAKKDYFFMGGTSMATPLVAGCAAVVRQYLRKKVGIAKPSGALLKSALIHSAQYQSYRFAHPSSAAPADNEQGWGRVELRSVLAPTSPASVVFVDQKAGLKTGEMKEFKVEVAASSIPLRVTMVYTDYPGKQLVNNLNLIVIDPSGTMVTGNDFTGSGSPDSQNNVEGVLVSSPVPGTWRVRVVASAVPKPKQDFALTLSAAGAKLV